MEEKIMDILRNKVRPELQNHGGDVEFCSYKDGVVELRMLGQCSGCPSAKFTNENVIEAALKEGIPEIKRVELSSCYNEEMLDFARKILNKEI